jgi:predicted nucleotidyltransferase
MIPSQSIVYVFGSALYSSTPDDLDVLVVYDPAECAPADAYKLHLEMVVVIQRDFDLPVHLTLLTQNEERDLTFIKRTGATEFKPFSRQSLPTLRK